MLFACPDCLAFYGDDLTPEVCPCGGKLFMLDDSRIPSLLGKGFRPAMCVDIGPGDHVELFERLAGAEICGAKLMQGEDGGRPSVQYLELSDRSRLWLTAGQGVAAIHAVTSYREVPRE